MSTYGQGRAPKCLRSLQQQELRNKHSRGGMIEKVTMEAEEKSKDMGQSSASNTAILLSFSEK